MLPLLLTLEIEASKPAEVLLTHGLVDRGASADPLPIIVRSVSPPVSLRFYVSEDYILNGHRKSGDLPGYVGLPAAPSLTEVLKYGLGFVSFDPIWHHVIDVHDDCGAELQVVLRLDALLGDGLSCPLRVTPFKLSGQQISKPTF